MKRRGGGVKSRARAWYNGISREQLLLQDLESLLRKASARDSPVSAHLRRTLNSALRDVNDRLLAIHEAPAEAEAMDDEVDEEEADEDEAEDEDEEADEPVLPLPSRRRPKYGPARPPPRIAKPKYGPPRPPKAGGAALPVFVARCPFGPYIYA